MAKKKDKSMKYLIVGGIIAYVLLQNNRQQYRPYVPSQSYVPPMPQPQTNNWSLWVQTILDLYGTAADLWGPGGPFYNIPIETINQNIRNDQQHIIDLFEQQRGAGAGFP